MDVTFSENYNVEHPVFLTSTEQNPEHMQWYSPRRWSHSDSRKGLSCILGVDMLVLSRRSLPADTATHLAHGRRSFTTGRTQSFMDTD